MTTILITGIGGSIGIDVARSLRKDSSLRLIGCDCSDWGLRQAGHLVDEVVALPRADRGAQAFLEALSSTIERTGTAFAFVNPDPELETLASIRATLPCPNSMPPIETVGITLDKAQTVAKSKLAGEFPQSYALKSDADIETCFAEMNPPLWLRSAVGPGGRGSLTVETPDEARAWIAYWRRRGKDYDWLVQEQLPGRNLNWTGIYTNGELRLAAAMERLRYFLGESAASGVSGQVALCATVDPAELEASCDRVVRSLDDTPHGLYSVDLRCDRDGKARVTEVNPRFAGRPWLYTNAGLNMPLAAARAFLGQDLGDAVSPDGLQVGMHLHRQLDIDPVVGFPAE
jgi:carbamoyl-phosphate synthase large subunit